MRWGANLFSYVSGLESDRKFVDEDLLGGLLVGA